MKLLWPSSRNMLAPASLLLVLWLFALTGCDKQSNQGGTDRDNNAPVTGRGSGEQGHSGGNGKPYDRGGISVTSNGSNQNKRASAPTGAADPDNSSQGALTNSSSQSGQATQK